ncbi:hypothetical protein DEO72_LG5g809 [Vigna unguiculata]|uniref:Uncharacterized protein n=1 Tax=Vigna unguiculata TaxID=3917 RepID=A0A4D6LW87_VIGUN|nr:hypothetical protein DEO72_LG5g809 [Vigna unguiculata]
MTQNVLSMRLTATAWWCSVWFELCEREDRFVLVKYCYGAGANSWWLPWRTRGGFHGFDGGVTMKVLSLVQRGGSMREHEVAVLASCMAYHTGGCGGVGTGAAGDVELSDELEWCVNGGYGSVTKWRQTRPNGDVEWCCLHLVMIVYMVHGSR